MSLLEAANVTISLCRTREGLWRARAETHEGSVRTQEHATRAEALVAVAGLLGERDDPPAVRHRRLGAGESR